MSSISSPVQDVLAAKQAVNMHQVQTRLLAKQLQVQEETGGALVELIEQVALASKQIAQGHLDVRV